MMMKYHFITIRLFIIKRKKKRWGDSAGKNVYKLEPSYIAGENVYYCCHCGNSLVGP